MTTKQIDPTVWSCGHVLDRRLKPLGLMNRKCNCLRRGRAYTEPMKQFATMKLGQAATKYGEQAPFATACCNVCRACVQTNLLTVALGAVAFVVTPIRRRLKRS